MVLRLFRVMYWVGFIAPILMIVLVIPAAIFGEVLVPIFLFFCALCGHAILIAVHYIICGQLVALPWRLK